MAPLLPPAYRAALTRCVVTFAGFLMLHWWLVNHHLPFLYPLPIISPCLLNNCLWKVAGHLQHPCLFHTILELHNCCVTSMSNMLNKWLGIFATCSVCDQWSGVDWELMFGNLTYWVDKFLSTFRFLVDLLAEDLLFNKKKKTIIITESLLWLY